MKSSCLRLAMLPLALAVAFPAWSETELAPVVVTASRVEQPLTDVLADVTVVDQETIQRSGAVSLTDILVQMPGLEISRNGGPLATTSLYTRGGNSNHTVILIDGVRIDTQSGSGGANCQAIPAQQIEHIEILRGPAAALYGSDAVAGVIQVFTHQGESGRLTPSVGLGFGSHGTQTLTASLSGRENTWDYMLSFGQEASDGYNIQPAANPDADSYKRTTGSAHVGWRILPDHKLDATWLSSDGNSGYDSTTAKTNSNYPLDNRSIQKLQAVGLTWQAKWSDIWSSRVGLTQADDHYLTKPSPSASPSYDTQTQVDNLLWHNTWKIGEHQWTAAFENRRDQLENSGTQPARTERDSNALALGYGAKWNAHTWQFNLREDSNNEFGAKTTGSLAYGYALTPAWRLTGGVGTAFRAPTLYQRFSEYGSSALKPEEANNREFGLKFAQKTTTFNAILYRTNVTNLINFGGTGSCSSSYGCYENTAKAVLQGITLSGTSEWMGMALNASLDVQNPIDANTDKRLARRAQQFLKAGVQVGKWGWQWAADVLVSGNRFDDAKNTKLLAGYGVLDFSATQSLTANTDILVRIHNVGDKSYETAKGYANEGRTFFVGLKWKGQ